MSRLAEFRSWWDHAFAVATKDEFTDADQELIESLARFVVHRGMVAPALLVLESGRPLNFVGSQLLAFLAPFVTLIFKEPEYDRFVAILEKRRSIDLIIEAIERRAHE